jgi:hypothetical protein
VRICAYCNINRCSIGIEAFLIHRAVQLTPPTFALKLAKELLRADEVIVEDPPRDVEQVRDQGVAYGVPHADAILASVDDVVAPQDSQLLRDQWLFRAKSLVQLLYVLFAVDQEFQDPNAKGMRERSEERGLECLQFVGGDFSHVAPFYLRDCRAERQTITGGWKHIKGGLVADVSSEEMVERLRQTLSAVLRWAEMYSPKTLDERERYDADLDEAEKTLDATEAWTLLNADKWLRTLSEKHRRR